MLTWRHFSDVNKLNQDKSLMLSLLADRWGKISLGAEKCESFCLQKPAWHIDLFRTIYLFGVSLSYLRYTKKTQHTQSSSKFPVRPGSVVQQFPLFGSVFIWLFLLYFWVKQSDTWFVSAMKSTTDNNTRSFNQKQIPIVVSTLKRRSYKKLSQ